jgi:hypothetical protein
MPSNAWLTVSIKVGVFENSCLEVVLKLL